MARVSRRASHGLLVSRSRYDRASTPTSASGTFRRTSRPITLVMARAVSPPSGERRTTAKTSGPRCRTFLGPRGWEARWRVRARCSRALRNARYAPQDECDAARSDVALHLPGQAFPTPVVVDGAPPGRVDLVGLFGPVLGKGGPNPLRSMEGVEAGQDVRGRRPEDLLSLAGGQVVGGVVGDEEVPEAGVAVEELPEKLAPR